MTELLFQEDACLEHCVARVVGFGPDKGRLDFDMAEPPADREALEARLNALIAGDHPVRAEWIEEAEFDASPGLVKTMAAQPPRGDGRVRLIRIGAPGATVDLQPCGGAHVRRTGEIGRAALGEIEKKGRRNRRVTVLLAECGGRDAGGG